MRLETQKRPEFIPLVAEKMRALIPTAKFIITGSGYMEDRVKEVAVERGVMDMLEFTGEIPLDEMEAQYTKAGAVLCPSRDEGIPLIYYEAMQRGVPLAASKVGAVGEVVPPEYLIEFEASDEAYLYAELLAKHLMKYTIEHVVNTSIRVSRDFSHGKWAERLAAIMGR